MSMAMKMGSMHENNFAKDKQAELGAEKTDCEFDDSGDESEGMPESSELDDPLTQEQELSLRTKKPRSKTRMDINLKSVDVLLPKRRK